MRKQELISKQKELARSSTKRLIVCFLLLTCFVMAIVPLSRYFAKHEDLSWINRVLGPCFPVVLMVTMVLLFLLEMRQRRQLGVSCPKCGKPLVGASAQVAIATGNCGHCGEEVFDDGSLNQAK